MQGTSSSQSVETISMFQAGGPDPWPLCVLWGRQQKRGLWRTKRPSM
jgi:hypothetical protein